MTEISSSARPYIDARWILDHLVERDAFEPVPHPSRARERWEKLASSYGNVYIDWADAHMDYDWPAVRASHTMAYGRHADRMATEGPYFERRMALQYFVMAECLTWQGKYLDKIIDGIWAICEETYWCLPPHMGAGDRRLLPDVSDPIVDLFASYTGQQLAWTVWLLKGQLNAVSPEVCRQVHRKVRYFVLDAIINHPCPWQALDPKVRLNNWTPWICATYLSSAWILEDRRQQFEHAISTVCHALNVFIDQQYDDGGCDEGVMYWEQAAGALYECLDQLAGMTDDDTLRFAEHPLIVNLARYPQVMHIAGQEFVCFADGRAWCDHLPGYWIHKWAEDLGDASLAAFGRELAQIQRPIGWQPLQNFYRQIQRPFCYDRMFEAAHSSKGQTQTDHWLPDLQVMTARQSPVSGKGWHVSAKGGHNDESHNHNDIGQFVVYRDGRPLLIDLGVETYTGKTFSDQRYDIFTMQSQWHNLPTFGQAVQLPGKSYAAGDCHWQTQNGVTTFHLDIAGAYDPQAHLRYCRRTIVLDRNQDVVQLSDAYDLARDQGPVMLSLITASDVRVDGQQLYLTSVPLPHHRQSAAAIITCEGVAFDAIEVEDKPITDPIMSGIWGDVVHRIKLTTNAVQNGQWQLTIRPA